MSMLTSSGPVKVLVVDDSVLMQKLMTQIINSTPGFQVIGVAGSAEEGWDAIQELRPDILTLDLELPGRHGSSARSTSSRSRTARPTRSKAS